jgi:hypothetical protein
MLFLLIVLAYLYYEARTGAFLLDDIRKQLLLAAASRSGQPPL